MYRFSRAIYRELAGEIIEDPSGPCAYANHERVLRACEAAIERLATDRLYFAQPARTLFCDVRSYFPVISQARVLYVIDRYLGCADDFLPASRRTATTCMAIRCSAGRRRARARRVSGCRYRTTDTALPTNIWRRVTAQVEQQVVADVSRTPLRVRRSAARMRI